MANFPSDEHYKHLSEMGVTGRISDEDLWAWHAYTYGWRRIMLQTRDDISPIDVKKEWFNDRFAAQAEIYYSRKLGIRPPDIGPPTNRDDLTPAQLAYIEARTKEITNNIAAFARNSRAENHRHRFDSERTAIRRVHEALSVSAVEAATDAD